MAVVDLTYEQILKAARQLPERQRKELVKSLEASTLAEQARTALRRLRGAYRMGPKKRKHMSVLLQKGNAGTLTADEKAELNCLVDEFQDKSLALARAVAAAVGGGPAGDGAAEQRSTSSIQGSRRSKASKPACSK